ncbi:hypothetical protein NUU61_003434 [Penicillium alfredii]|uniref:Uncharacterized protein n=1 Tax=Penicillium alfredii TaxID=1506179 RepID=A0A9W9FUS8_9EURO|nr:uncharacterized protein NUU61_003434 [Penicillium alfredii]KAJ5106087.1 hypothetical protein NUU61_003434 [Penicillium alfredii]
MPAALPPITGMLRRGLVLDLSTAFGEFVTWFRGGTMNMRAECRGSLANNGLEYNPMEEALGFGTTFGYLWWYGYHLPRVRERDAYYSRLEQERAAQRA